VENLLAHNFSSISTSLATTTTQITEAAEPTSTTIATTGVNQQVLDVLSQTNRLYIATAVLVSIALITVAYGLRKKWRSEFN
jgi:hypothetical protein